MKQLINDLKDYSGVALIYLATTIFCIGIMFLVG